MPAAICQQAMTASCQELSQLLALLITHLLSCLQGCGIIVYEHITAAIAAMEALHNKYHWTGGETTMVVEWADPSRHRRENPNTKGRRDSNQD